MREKHEQMQIETKRIMMEEVNARANGKQARKVKKKRKKTGRTT